MVRKNVNVNEVQTSQESNDRNASSRKERSFDKKCEQRHRNDRNKHLVRSYEEVDLNNIMLSDSHQENPGNEK